MPELETLFMLVNAALYEYGFPKWAKLHLKAFFSKPLNFGSKIEIFLNTSNFK